MPPCRPDIRRPASYRLVTFADQRASHRPLARAGRQPFIYRIYIPNEACAGVSREVRGRAGRERSPRRARPTARNGRDPGASDPPGVPGRPRGTGEPARDPRRVPGRPRDTEPGLTRGPELAGRAAACGATPGRMRDHARPPIVEVGRGRGWAGAGRALLQQRARNGRRLPGPPVREITRRGRDTAGQIASQARPPGRGPGKFPARGNKSRR